MRTYYVSETQNLQSIRQAEPISAEDLTTAEKIAVENQVFQGTVLKIYSDVNENGYGVNELARLNA